MRSRGAIGWPMMVIVGIIFAIIMIAIYVALTNFQSNLRESRQVQASSFLLAEAIDDVYINAVKLDNIDYTREVNVTLPGSGRGGIAFFKREQLFPKWLIYKGPYGGGTIEVIDNAFSGSTGLRNCDGICYGIVRKYLPEQELESSYLTGNFWLLNPCEARIEVYYGAAAGDNSGDDRVRLRFLEVDPNGNGRDFCCNDNRNIIGLNSPWPDDGDAERNMCSWQVDEPN